MSLLPKEYIKTQYSGCVPITELLRHTSFFIQAVCLLPKMYDAHKGAPYFITLVTCASSYELNARWPTKYLRILEQTCRVRRKKISSFEFASAHASLHEQCSFRRNEVKKKHREKEGGKCREETKNILHVMIRQHCTADVHRSSVC